MSTNSFPLNNEIIKEADFKLKVVHQSSNFLVIAKNFDLVMNDNDPQRFSLAKVVHIAFQKSRFGAACLSGVMPHLEWQVYWD